MSTTTTGDIRNLLVPGLDSVYGSYAMYPAQWKEIYKEYKSEKAFELDVEMQLLGLPEFRPEGAPTAVQSMRQAVITKYVHKTLGLQVIMTKDMMDDNLYQSSFPMTMRSLKNSLHQAEEILGAAVLNNAANALYPLGDGQPLLSLVHPISGGVVANTPSVQMDLSETSLQYALEGIEGFQDQAGLTVMVKAQKLIVPSRGQWAADMLLRSTYYPENANNAVNPIVGMIPKSYRVNQFLLNPTSWFILTDADNGFKRFTRIPLTVSMYADFTTDNLLTKAIIRLCYGVSNFRAVFGSMGTSA